MIFLSFPRDVLAVSRAAAEGRISIVSAAESRNFLRASGVSGCSMTRPWGWFSRGRNLETVHVPQEGATKGRCFIARYATMRRPTVLLVRVRARARARACCSTLSERYSRSARFPIFATLSPYLLSRNRRAGKWLVPRSNSFSRLDKPARPEPHPQTEALSSSRRAKKMRTAWRWINFVSLFRCIISVSDIASVRSFYQRVR